MNLDIFFHIADYLDTASYLSLRLTCKELYDFLPDKEVINKDIFVQKYYQLFDSITYDSRPDEISVSKYCEEYINSIEESRDTYLKYHKLYLSTRLNRSDKFFSDLDMITGLLKFSFYSEFETFVNLTELKGELISFLIRYCPLDKFLYYRDKYSTGYYYFRHQDFEEALKYNNDNNIIIHIFTYNKDIISQEKSYNYPYNYYSQISYALCLAIRYSNFEVMNHINDKINIFRNFINTLRNTDIIREGILTFDKRIVDWLKVNNYRCSQGTIPVLISQLFSHIKEHSFKNYDKLRLMIIYSESLFSDNLDYIIDILDNY